MLDFSEVERPVSRPFLSVSELNRMVAVTLERGLPVVGVVGEISNFVRATSGHWYFTLKDSSAQVRAVMFRGRAQTVDFSPREGDRVEVRALAGLYQARGEFQLSVEAMRRAGAGDLFQRFLQIRDRLQAEGLFDVARKRALPGMPRAVGVITSLKAAALRDVLTTLRRRSPQIPVVLYPTAVQGADAPASIVAALSAAVRRAECDVLLLVRGGGSIEDLWAFNDETLARAIAASPIPVVSGVGHETDFTIADFVADARAPTPTAAASLAVPERRELADAAHFLGRRLARAWRASAQARDQRLDTASRLLRSPAAYRQAKAQALDSLAHRLVSAARVGTARAGARLEAGASRMRPPDLVAAALRAHTLTTRLVRAQRVAIRARGGLLDSLERQLALVSPDAVLQRGYAIVTRADGSVLRSAPLAAVGEQLGVVLAHGALQVTVDHCDAGDASPRAGEGTLA